MKTDTYKPTLHDLCVREREKLRALNAELLAALKLARQFNVINHGRPQIDAAIAKAEGRE